MRLYSAIMAGTNGSSAASRPDFGPDRQFRVHKQAVALRRTVLKPLAAIFVLVVSFACSGGSSSSPTAPTAPSVVAPVVTGLSISNSSSTLLIGQGETLTATTSYSDGSTRTTRPAWSSSNSSIVSVDGNGRLTATAAGMATITATADGRSASTEVRGLPDFAGVWTAQYRATACDVPPRWGAGFCNLSGVYNATVNLSRSGVDGIVGSYNNGYGWIGTVSGRVATNGTLSLTGRLTSVRPTATFHSDFVSWTAQMSPGLGFTGSYSETLTWVGERDKGFIAGSIIRATK